MYIVRSEQSNLNAIYHTSLHTDHLRGELRFILTCANLILERYRSEENDGMAVPICRLNLPLSLWPQFHEAVCCLGTFMKPLPAPAYQTRSCCSYTCPSTPETIVLELDHQERLHLSIQDRRGSTFLEIKSVHSFAAKNSGKVQTICIGPTLWSAFLTTLQTLAQIIADL